MKIVCIGGGPAGLTFAMLARLCHPEAEVTVLERNARGVTYGWGVVFPEALLRGMSRHCPDTATEIARSATMWIDQHVHVRGARPAHLGRHGYSIGRAELLEILGSRAERLGVSIQCQDVVDDLGILEDADLVVAADGANSRLRASRAGRFGTRVLSGQNRYIWLGTSREFPAFTFGFESTPAGWIWFHAYRYAPAASTFIAECSAETWQGLGLDRLDAACTTRRLEEIFAGYLDRHRLTDQMGPLGKVGWQTFGTISNETWVDGNLVLIGDAAHTAHFSIGSGTLLAVGDALALADQLRTRAALPAVLAAYEAQRRPEVEHFQAAARNSASWFERIPELIEQPAVDFAYGLLRRREGPSVRSETGPRWRYPMYRAMQWGVLSEARRWITATRRRWRPKYR